MKHLYNYLTAKQITVKDFENMACVILDRNDKFIPFATQELMQHYSLSSDCEVEVSMLLAQLLQKHYVFAR